MHNHFRSNRLTLAISLAILGLSAHADQAGLLDWLRGFHAPPRHTCVVHGEAGASATFAQAIRDQLGWRDVMLPQKGESVTL